MKRLLLLAALVLCAPSAHAEVVIKDDPGGSFGPYIQKYLDLAYSGERVRIDGYCNSACTFVVALPRKQVCIEPGASLGFHSASWGPGGSFTKPGTQFMWDQYPAIVRAMLRKRGWQGTTPHPQIMSLTGAEMRRLYRAC